jgi:hypothetical protein
MRQTLLMGFVLKHIDLLDFGKNIRCATAKYESRLEKVEVRLDKVEASIEKKFDTLLAFLMKTPLPIQ